MAFWVDAVVLGAGIQGLAVANELRKRGNSTIVVTNSLIGEGQSTHNHGYFHEGYIFMPSPPTLLSKGWSEDLIKEIQYDEKLKMYFAAPEQMFTYFSTVWDKFEFPYNKNTPDAYTKGELNNMVFAEIGDFVFSKRKLLDSLLKNQTEMITFGDVTNVKKLDNGTVEIVVNQNTIRCKALVLCAGGSNLSVIRKFFPNESNYSQKVKNIHMLCVKGPRSILPLDSVVCWAKQVMIVAHPHGEHESLYYVSAFTKEQNAEDSIKEIPSSQLGTINPAIINSAVQILFNILPKTAEQRAQLKWQAYAGYKVEHPEKNEKWIPYVTQLEKNSNIIQVSPNIVSTIFQNAQDVADIIGSLPCVEKQAEHTVGNICGYNKIADYTEDVSSWQNWSDFASQYSIRTESLL